MNSKRTELRTAVLRSQKIAQDTHLLVIRLPEGALEGFVPGQFAHIRIPNAKQLVLRRPFSICTANPAAGEVSVVYKVRGEGTEELTRVKPGDTLNVLGPLGTGFRIPAERSKIWLVGGGVGSAPLFSVPIIYPGHDYEVFVGFSSLSHAFGTTYFNGLFPVHVCTDDNSTRRSMPVTQLVRSALETGRPDLMLACGPAAMYRELAKITQDVEVQISIEERMGCGIGGCETCVCSVGGDFVKSCTDGPVFNLKEVDDFHV